MITVCAEWYVLIRRIYLLIPGRAILPVISSIKPCDLTDNSSFSRHRASTQFHYPTSGKSNNNCVKFQPYFISHVIVMYSFFWYFFSQQRIHTSLFSLLTLWYIMLFCDCFILEQVHVVNRISWERYFVF